MKNNYNVQWDKTDSVKMLLVSLGKDLFGSSQVQIN